jgi:hypothetical protein
MTSRKNWLSAKVSSEGYCCLNGYLRLCRLRGETVEGMAKNIGMSADTIWYHYRKLDTELAVPNAPVCMKQMDCMKPVIDIIESDSTPNHIETDRQTD